MLTHFELIVGNRLRVGRLLKKRNEAAHDRIIRAATAKLEHEYETRKAAGTAKGTFLEWLERLPWAEIMRILAQLIPLFA